MFDGSLGGFWLNFSRQFTFKNVSKRTLELKQAIKEPLKTRDLWWTHKGSNLGPLPCEGNALPLSYAPGNGEKIAVRARDLRRKRLECQAISRAVTPR